MSSLPPPKYHPPAPCLRQTGELPLHSKCYFPALSPFSTLSSRLPLKTSLLCVGLTVRTCWVTSRYFCGLNQIFVILVMFIFQGEVASAASIDRSAPLEMPTQVSSLKTTLVSTKIDQGETRSRGQRRISTKADER